MENPLKYFKDLIENHDIVFMRNVFSKTQTYNKDDDKIQEIVVDDFNEKEYEIRLSFRQYLTNRLRPQVLLAMKVLDKNLHNLKSGNEEEEYITKVEREVNYLLKKLLSQPDSETSEVISNELERLKSHINGRYRENLPKSVIVNKISKEKVVWKGSHSTFFALFRALHDEGLLGAGTSKDYLIDVAKLLYAYIDIKPKQGKVDEYSFKSFYQQLKEVKNDKDGQENYAVTKIKKVLQQLD